MSGQHRVTRSLRVLGVGLVILAAIGLAACDLARPGARPTPTTALPTPLPGAPQFTAVPLRGSTGQPLMVPGQIILKLQAQPAVRALTAAPQADGIIATGLSDVDALNRRFGVKTLDPLIKPLARASGQSIQAFAASQPDLVGLYVAKFDPKNDPNLVAAAYTGNPSVIYAEPNFYAYADDGPVAPVAMVPNDPYFAYQWNFPLIQMPQAWDTSNGQGVLVAELDTGIAYENYDVYQQAPDLANTRFLPGYDFVNGDTHANDDEGHGTHVAGTIAQSTNNGIGVAGVAYGATLMPVKVLDANGQGSYDTIAQGIVYAANQGAKVINMSLSGKGGSNSLLEAVDYATRKGVLVIAAAGNSSGPVEYPAAYDGVVAVGAVGYDSKRVDYSDYGPQIDLVAPGGNTNVDLNGDGYPDGILQQTFQGSPTSFGYYLYEGTSMATPHVSGVAALLFARNPSASAAQVRQALQTTALDLGPAGPDNEYGNGLVQAANALVAIGGGPTATPTPTLTPPPGATPTPTSPPGVTPTPTPTVGPPPVTGDLIVNGGFETSGGWIFGYTPRPGDYATNIVHSGARSARLGIVSGPDIYSYSSVWQAVAIPPGVRRATLTYWIYPISQDTYPRDLQMVLVLNDQFRVLTYAERMLSNSQQWTQRSYDMTRYAGRTVMVYFGVLNQGWTGRTSAMYVDDVALTVEQ
jgi:serine protease